jgi:phosphate transport system protein
VTRTAEAILAEIREMTLRMGALAEAILDKALRAVRERRKDLREEVERDDVEIDRLEVALDEAILRALALQAPVAEDLRLVVAAKAMATDLERIGDLARNVARSAERLAERAPTSFPSRLGPLAEETRRMLRSSLDSYRDHDPDAARAVIGADDRADEFKDRIVRDMIAEIGRDPDVAPQAIDVILIAENLERVGDHATNLAEDVILVAEARNVKHAQKLGGTA